MGLQKILFISFCALMFLLHISCSDNNTQNNEIKETLDTISETMKSEDIDFLERMINIFKSDIRKMDAKLDEIKNNKTLTDTEFERIKNLDKQKANLERSIHGYNDLIEKIKKGEKYSRPWAGQFTVMEIDSANALTE